MAGQVRKRAKKARVHADSGTATGLAQAAGKNPATERSRAGALATVAAIDAVKPPVDSFRVKLIAALKDALPKEPKNADEAKAAKGKSRESSQQISAALGTASEETTGTLEAASQPGSDVKAEGPETPEVKLVPEVPGTPPAPVAAGPAVPESVPPPDLSGDRAESDKAMADAGVSKDQLAKSNEPEFTAVLQAREGAERTEAQRAEQFKTGEGGILAKQQGQTGAMLGQGLGSIHGARSDGLGLVGGKQTETQSKEAAERTRVTGLIEGIKNKTREAVLEILKLMETAATTAFAAGLGLAEKAYEAAFEENKGGAWNWLTNWGDDWERLIEQSFKKGRAAYDRIVTETVNSVADIVETRLALAKARVQQGRKEVDDFVAGLTGESAKYGEEARTQIASEFEAMDGEIDAKRDEMVTALVDQYRESQKRVSALEEKLREANKSLWQRIKDATIGIIKKIIAFKNFLLDVLARMAQVVSAIIDDPIGFLGNLINGIMAGMDGFRSRIGQHLKKGLMEWLFGALEGAGIKIPETFDLKGIVGLVMQILGLTWENIKARAIKVLGADTVAYLEKSWEIFQVLIKEGPGGLWRMLVEKIGDIKEMLLTQLGDFVKEKIIEAGIKWVLSLLNPVAAFIKACMAIYDIVKFFIDRAAQIASLINAILDTLGAIVKGNIAAMATSVENALARMIPVAIGFLASLLGLGGISDKIKAVIDKLRAPVNAAIDWIIGKAAGLVKKGFGFVKNTAQRVAEWWRQRRAVKLGGQSHTLSFEGSQEHPVLMLASKQRPVQDHLADAIKDETLSEAARAKAKEALDFYNLKFAPISAAKPPANRQALIDALPDNLNEFSNLLVAISAAAGGASALPKPESNYNAPSVASVEKLSGTHGGGGKKTGSADPKGFSLLRDRGLTTTNGNWVRMHMISAAYGGLDIPGNLIPAPTGKNTEAGTEFEADIKKTIYGDIESSGTGPDHSVFAADIAKRKTVLWLRTASDGFYPAQTDPQYDSSTFAISVSMTAGIYFQNAKEWVKSPNPLVSHTVDLPPPDFSDEYVPGIDSIGEGPLSKKAGISLFYGREIKKFDHFENAIELSQRAVAAGAVSKGMTLAIQSVVAAVRKGKLKWGK